MVHIFDGEVIEFLSDRIGAEEIFVFLRVSVLIDRQAVAKCIEGGETSLEHHQKLHFDHHKRDDHFEFWHSMQKEHF